MGLLYKHPLDTNELFNQAEKLDLYFLLIDQLHKDFTLAGIEINVNYQLAPSSLFDILHDKIFNLIQSNFATYLNLLYVMDVPENDIKKLDGSDLVELSKTVSFLILKRLWQKVWFKKFYS